ncbi:TerD family protein [Clostridium novyi]|uniref:TerD family protein n=1 Tax=Clostridium novyi TaxID=1542 RepID=UPI00069D75DF|nr:TerD family protein [Clostridium novyi]
MNLNINEKNKAPSIEKRYGNLIVETTIKEDRGIIDLTNPSSYRNTMDYAINEVASTRISEEDNSEVKVHNVKKHKKINTVISSDSSIKLKRGQKVALNKGLNKLSKLVVALDWNINYGGRHEFDLDTSIFMLDINKNTAEDKFIFYGNPKSIENSVVLGEDFNLKLKDYYDERIMIDLDLVPDNIEKLAITVTIYDGEKRGQNFSSISNGIIRIIDSLGKNQIFSYEFNEGLKLETAVVVAEIYRHNGQWKLNPVGNGFNGGLEALCENYGIKVQ